jgi:hypothetical protein
MSFFYEGGVYGHKKIHVDKSKSILNRGIIDDIDNDKPTNISIPSATNPPSSPSSSSSVPSASLTSNSSSTRKIRRLSDIYQRTTSQAHGESPIREIINFSLLSNVDFVPSCFEDARTNEVWVKQCKKR